MFFLRRPRRKAPTTVEPAPLTPESDPPPGPTLQTYAVAQVVDELPDEIPGIPDLYAILGVDPRSSDEIIRYAYRRRASRLYERRWRPGQATRQLAELNAAYEILGKPDRRSDYDRRRVRRAVMEHALNGSFQSDGIATGRALPSGQRHGASRLRLVPGGGLLETVVIVAVIALAAYAAVVMLSSRSLVDLSGILEITETLGLSQRRRATPTPVPTVAPTPVSAQPDQMAAAGPAPALIQPAAAAAPTTAPAPAPSKLESGFDGSAAEISNANPPPRSDVSVVARVLRGGRPHRDAQVHSIVHYKTVDERYPPGVATQATDENGTATISFNIGDAVPGYPVNVDVIAAADGEQTQLQTSFTPR